MPAGTVKSLVEVVKRAALPLEPSRGELSAVASFVGGADVVLLGEATHGTHEFYNIRAALTQRLIEEGRLEAVAVEADWPDAFRLNRYVRGVGTDPNAYAALGDFVRFPTWMWRNIEVLNFVEWLKEHNARKAPEERVGFYGLDLYSLHSSMAWVVSYLEKVDPAAAAKAKARYGCFDHFGEDGQEYASAAAFGMSDTCEQQVIAQLRELRSNAEVYASRDGVWAEEEQFSAEQNARLALNAERYYRQMYRGNISSWNQRDTHMAEALDSLAAHTRTRRGKGRVAVWAHNSHLGDARATSMSRRGELNLGQLVRQTYGARAVSIGFTTYTGTVSAASEWGGQVRKKRVRPALPGSVELLFHEVDRKAFFLPLRDELEAKEALADPLLERAIGVLYLPESERQSHYFEAAVSEQFDAIIHVDHTHALQPLETTAMWTAEPETYPSGL